MRVKRIPSVLAVLSLGVFAACASGGATTDDSPPAASSGATTSDIVIQHNKVGVGAVQLFMVPDGGTVAQLGLLDSNATRTFTYNVTQAGVYRIRAQRTDGGANFESATFNLRAGQRATWNMQLGDRVLVQNR